MDSQREKAEVGLLLRGLSFGSQIIVRATDGYTGAHIEELTNTLYIFALDGQNHGDTVSGNGRVVIDRKMIDAVVEEVHVERKRAAGFAVT